MLTSLELTGRASTHVRRVAGLQYALHERAGEALVAMRAAARAAGIDLIVVSGFRDFERQRAIWSAKFRGERRLLDRSGCEIEHEPLSEAERIDAILIWSALPGASRHHWGSDLDVADAASIPAGQRPQLQAREFEAGGPFARLDAWLRENMKQFGFFRPYSVDRGGVQPEPWHLSYGPVSGPALESFSLRLLREAIESAEMPGREAVLRRLPELYDRYVQAVDFP